MWKLFIFSGVTGFRQRGSIETCFIIILVKGKKVSFSGPDYRTYVSIIQELRRKILINSGIGGVCPYGVLRETPRLSAKAPAGLVRSGLELIN